MNRIYTKDNTMDLQNIHTRIRNLKKKGKQVEAEKLEAQLKEAEETHGVVPAPEGSGAIFHHPV